MSSDSELDEYYDVEENSPGPGRSPLALTGSASSKPDRQMIAERKETTSTSMDYDLEKQKILDQLFESEQRRRKEEEDLKLQLSELDAKREALKKAELPSNQAIEQDTRYQKLAELRSGMTSSGVEGAPSKPPRMFLYSDDEDDKKPTHMEQKPSKPEDGSRQNTSRQDTASAMQASRHGMPDREDSFLSSASSDDFQTLPRNISLEETFRDALQGDDNEEDSSDSESAMEVNDDTKALTEDLVKKACASGLLKTEPDLIQSTKSSLDQDQSDPMNPDGPVAPPRRRRKPKGEQTSIPSTTPESNEGAELISPEMTSSEMTGTELTGAEVPVTEVTDTEGTLPAGLVDLSSSSGSTFSNSSRDVEHSLDLQSATCGSRIVTATEDDSAKADIIFDSSSFGTRASRDDTSSVETLTPQASPLQNETLTPIPAIVTPTVPLTTPSLPVATPTSSTTTTTLPSKTSTTTILMAKEAKATFSSAKTNKSSTLDAATIEALSKGMKKSESLDSQKIYIKSEDSDGEIRIKGVPRPRSNSGSRYLTDTEILQGVQVLNLDTGEQVLLSEAEHKIPTCANPLSLHIMRRTQEYSSDSSLHKNPNSDDDAKEVSGMQTIRSDKQPTKRRKTKLKEMFGKTVHKIKSVADEVLHHEESYSDDDDDIDCRKNIKVKAANAHKGPYDFDLLVPIQELGGEYLKAVWCMKFSHCGKLLATGGQDNKLRVWVLKDAFAYFEDMRQKYNEAAKVSPTPSQDSLSSQSSDMSRESEATCADDNQEDQNPFMRKPFCIYKGHTADLLDLSWSKNYFILTSSMDKMVRLWHISRKECLCCFQHIDFVTAIAFHPKDDRYFLSGSLDGKLRMWSIPDKKVALWNEVQGQTKLITAANFCLHGRFAVVGTYDGRCIFYSTDKLKYHTQIHVRSTRGRNARGRKITGIDPQPGGEKVLVTSNDSRIRLYDLRDLTLTCKYRGCSNNSSQIKASFNQNGKYIICGSEDHFVYVWRTQHDVNKMSSARKDRNIYWEGIKAHTAVVTVAIFAPNPGQIIKPQFAKVDSDDQDEVPAVRGEVLVSADFSGNIRVFINKFKPGSG